jgi:hypothetical protein
MSAIAAPATAPAMRPAESADQDVHRASDVETPLDHDGVELVPVLAIEADGRCGL